MKKITTVVALLLNAYILPAQYTAVFKLSFPQQYHALDSIVDLLVTKDSANTQQVIRQMGVAAAQTNNELTLLNFRRSVLNYEYIHSHDLNNRVVLNKIIKDAKDLLQQVDERKYPEIAAMIHVTLGNTYYYKVHQYSPAFAHFIEAYNLFKNVSTARFPDRHYAQYAIALAYYQFSDYANALLLGKEIESIYPLKDHVSLFTMQMIGLCYIKLKNYDSALRSFQWVLNNTLLSHHPTAWKGIAFGSMGNVYFFENKYDKAVPYLDSGVVYTTKDKVPDNTADFAAHLATIYLEQKNLTVAKKYVDIARQAAYEDNNLTSYCTVYQGLSDYYKATGNSTLALLYLDSTFVYKDSLTRIHDVNLMYQAEMAVEKERSVQQKELFAQEKLKEQIVRNAIIGFILLSMIVALLLYNRSLLKNKHREQQLLSEKQQAEVELKNAGIQLTEFTKSIIDKNELIDKVTKEMERLLTANQELQHQRTDIQPAKIVQEHSLKLLQESVLLTDDDWKNFTHLFDKVHQGFFIRLKENLPVVSPAETRFVALLKLRLSTKEMAGMMGISTDAIRQTKSRLKKKLNIVSDHELESAIDSL